MTTLREAAEMALDALEVATTPRSEDRQTVLKAQAALREALATCKESLPVDLLSESEREIKRLRAELFEALCKRHVEAEPVAWIFTWYEIAKDRHVRRIIDCEERPNIPGYDLIPLYTSPPQRKPLTEEQIKPIFDQWKILYGGYTIDFIRAIERAHGIGSQE